MMKMRVYLLFLTAFIISCLGTYFVTTYILANKFEIEKQELINEYNDTRENIDLNELLVLLNTKKVLGYDLVNEFSLIHYIHLPLYEIEEVYEYSKKTTETNMLLAVSLQIRGTYRINPNLLCNVFIIKDLTSDNSGFIHANRNYSSNNVKESIFYYNGIYIVYSFEFLNSDELTMTAEDDLFIQKFFEHYTQITY